MSHARLRRCWYIAHGNGGGAFLYGVFVCIGELVRDTNTSTHLHCLEGYQGKRCCGEEILPIFPFGHGTEKRDRVERKILISLRTLRSQPVSPDSLFWYFNPPTHTSHLRIKTSPKGKRNHHRCAEMRSRENSTTSSWTVREKPKKGKKSHGNPAAAVYLGEAVTHTKWRPNKARNGWSSLIQIDAQACMGLNILRKPYVMNVNETSL